MLRKITINLGVQDRTILKGILKEQSIRMWTGFNWLWTRFPCGLF